jgi:hypothetical protein
VCALTGRPDEARAALEKTAAALGRKWVGKEFARYHLACDEQHKAMAVLLEAIETERNLPDPLPADVAQLLELLAEAKVRTGDLSRGRSLLSDVIDTYARTLGPTHPDLARALETYARLFPRESVVQAARAGHIRAANRENEPRGFESVFGFIK